MGTVKKASLKDLENIVRIDSEVIGNTSRRTYIKGAMEQGRCLIVQNEAEIGAFLIYNTHFFDCTFVSLIMVAPSKRRKGYASLLLDHMMSIAPTKKVFSSTNQSNVAMHKVFGRNGFVESGIVDNVDEGDPEIIFFKAKNI